MITTHLGAATGTTLYGWACTCGRRASIRFSTMEAAQDSSRRHVCTNATAAIEPQGEPHAPSQ